MVEEFVNDRRSFIGPDGVTEYFIGPPSANIIRGADWQYSKVYTKCLTEGISTSSEMTDTLKRRGIIGDQFDERVEELSINLRRLILDLDTSDSNEEKATTALKVSKARDDLFQWNQRLSVPMSNTCEQIADDARLEYLTAHMIETDLGTKVWKDYETFLNTKNQALILKARYEVMLYLQGYDSDFLDKTPEAVAMQEIQTDIINQVAQEIEDKEAERVELEEQELVDQETEIEKVVEELPKKISNASKKSTKKVVNKTKKSN